jgi:hypothetical protein
MDDHDAVDRGPSPQLAVLNDSWHHRTLLGLLSDYFATRLGRTELEAHVSMPSLPGWA